MRQSETLAAWQAQKTISSRSEPGSSKPGSSKSGLTSAVHFNIFEEESVFVRWQRENATKARVEFRYPSYTDMRVAKFFLD